jgi:lipase maturation factor 1
VDVMDLRGTLIFDGECGFCCLWIERWREMCGGAVRFVAYQEAEIPGLDSAACARAVQWVGADGERAEGAAAVFRAMAAGGGLRAVPLWMYNTLPGFAGLTEFAYRVVAAHRGVFSWFTWLFWGSDVRRPGFAAGMWWFLRALSAIFALAFVSYWIQMPGLVGERGILPAGEFFSAAEAAGVGFWDMPGILWWGAGEGTLALWCAVGLVVSVFALVGILQGPCLLVAWGLYLSLCTGGQVFYQFQWDGLLLEAGFLGALAAPWRIWQLGPCRLPGFARLLIVWLLVRLMLSSGLAKLMSGDPTWWPEMTALTFHYFTQPLPTPLAWLADQLPIAAQQFSVGIMFLIELIAPWLLFAPRRLRHASAGALIGLQAAIALTGNYGFFNLLTMALCLASLDDSLLRWPRMGVAKRPARSGLPLPVLVPVGAVYAVMSLVPLAAIMGWTPPMAHAYAAIAPFRTVNPYGLFATMTRERPEIIVQGSRDGIVWETYEFWFKPGDVKRAPPVVAPYMPRLDWQMWFAALGRPTGNPWFIRFAESLLHAEPAVLSLIKNDPFDGQRPRFIRAQLDTHQFASPSQKKSEGIWWVAEPRAIYLPEVALDPASGQ